MWERFKRVIRSIIGNFISMAEDPIKILEQNDRDARDALPGWNKNLAEQRGVIVQQEEREKELDRSIKSLGSKIRACLAAGDRVTAGQFATELKIAQTAFEGIKADLVESRLAYTTTQEQRQQFIIELKRKSAETSAAIKGAKAAEWQRKIASTIQSFDVADISATHDEQIAKLNERSALGKGAMLSAMESLKDNKAKIEMEKKVAAFEGEEILKQVEFEMGLTAKPVVQTVPNQVSIDEANLTEFTKSVNSVPVVG